MLDRQETYSKNQLWSWTWWSWMCDCKVCDV